MNKIELFLPILTVSEANNSDHWTKKRKRVLAQQKILQLYLSKYHYNLPCIVTMTRIGKRFLDKEENLPMAFKYIKDQIAEIIVEYQMDLERKIKNLPPKFNAKKPKGWYDSDPRIEWRYAQQKGKEKGIKITIESANTN